MGRSVRFAMTLAVTGVIALACNDYGSDEEPPTAPLADAGPDHAIVPLADTGSDATEASTRSGCATAAGALFCDDFEVPFTERWPGGGLVKTEASGVIDRVTRADALSPSNVMRVTVAATTPACSTISLNRVADVGFRSVRMTFGFRVNAITVADSAATNLAYVFATDTQGQRTNQYFQLLGPERLTAHDEYQTAANQFPFDNHDLPSLLTLRTWHRAEITIDLARHEGRMLVDAMAVSYSLKNAALGGAGSSIAFGVGPTCLGVPISADLEYDDVIVTTE